MSIRGNRKRADTEESITPGGPDEWLSFKQETVSRKLFDLPHSMDGRRALPGYSAEIKKSRRLKLVWMRKLLRRSRKFTREAIEDMIYEKAFDHGLRQNGRIMEKGNPAWNNPILCIKNMSQYISSISANDSEELFYVYEDGGRW
jgi:hypothetical protein